MDQVPKTPNIVASTGAVYRCSISESRVRESTAKNSLPIEGPLVPVEKEPKGGIGIEEEEVNYFKSAQWTPDGTSILTSSADNTIRTFIVPSTLLDDTSSPTTLLPYTTHLHPTSVNCIVAYPFFSLSNPSTALYLSAPNALPIRLTNALSPTPTPASTYNLISPTTEAYLTPSSLLWSSQRYFFTGTDCLIAAFDISRNGEGPTTRLPTIPSKRHKMKGGGVGMRGIVSALSHQLSSEHEEGMLAAGTWTRWVGLYDAGGMGGTVATWSIAEAADVLSGVGGMGVTQTSWSACGKYLFVAERKSRGVLVYDVRVTGKLVAWLEGREADTNQRLSIDVFQAEAGPEIWGGGVDGVVRVWEAVGMTEGSQERSWEWRAHDDPISSTMIHTSGTVVATCSGQRSFQNDEADIEDTDVSDTSEDETTASPSTTTTKPMSRTPDNSLNLWSL